MEKTYKKESLNIHWKPELCIHSANCIKGLPRVFNPKIKPWVNQENAGIDELITTINTCPSGALSYSLDLDKELITVDTKSRISIKINESGPIIISDGCIIDYQGKSIEKEGTVALCRCGQSENKPFCDGTHKKVGFDTKE